MAVFAGRNTPKFTPVRKGLLWLLLATIAEVPPTVRLAILSYPFFRTYRNFMSDVHDFESER